MNSQFITNQSKLLSEIFKNIILLSENLYFLISYIYFSDIKEIQNEVNEEFGNTYRNRNGDISFR